MQKEVNIDIGGGERAEFFVDLACRDRNSLYIVLDPQRFRCPYTELYPNLSLVRWRSGVTTNGSNWELPFKDASIDNAYLSNIYGFMDETTLTWPILHDQNKKSPFDKNKDDIYSTVISSLKRVMKHSGIVHVQEAQGIIPIVRQIYLEQGFRIIDAPNKIPHEDMTPTSFFLLGLAEKGVRIPEESVYWPMQFTAGLAQVKS